MEHIYSQHNSEARSLPQAVFYSRRAKREILQRISIQGRDCLVQDEVHAQLDRRKL